MTEAPDYGDDASPVDLPGLVVLAERQRAAEAEVARLEAALAEAKQRLYAVRDQLLPQAMTAVGLSLFQLDDGWRVEVRESYRCGQLDDALSDDPKKRPLADRLAGLRWLEEHGGGAPPQARGNRYPRQR